LRGRAWAGDRHGSQLRRRGQQRKTQDLSRCVRQKEQPMRREVQALIAAAALWLGAGAAEAQYSDGVIKIGVMNDQSGTYSDLSGQGSVWAAKKAIEDFCKTSKCHDKIEVVFADHQNKPDVGSNIVRQWFDVDKVDTVVDVPTSSVALAVNTITKEKNKV